jgi:hypothetical protein
MGDTRTDNGFLRQMQLLYPDNLFITKGLWSESIPKWAKHKEYNDAPQLRTYDLNDMDDQYLLMYQSALGQLKPEHRNMIINYALITKKGAIGKGSLAQLIDPQDTIEFNKFLKTFNVSDYDPLFAVYKTYFENSNESPYYHNAIPYTVTNNGTGTKTATVKTEQVKTGDIISSDLIKNFNTIVGRINGKKNDDTKYTDIPTGFKKNTLIKISNQSVMETTFSGYIDHLINNESDINPFEKSDLKAIKDAVYKTSTSEKKAETRKKICKGGKSKTQLKEFRKGFVPRRSSKFAKKK